MKLQYSVVSTDKKYALLLILIAKCLSQHDYKHSSIMINMSVNQNIISKCKWYLVNAIMKFMFTLMYMQTSNIMNT